MQSYTSRHIIELKEFAYIELLEGPVKTLVVEANDVVAGVGGHSLLEMSSHGASWELKRR